MPQAPDNYQPPSKKATEGMDRHRADEGSHYESGPNQYSHRRYREWRQRMKDKQRTADEQRVHEVYKSLESKSFYDYMGWLSQDNPLCVDCLEEGLIKPGRVLDHKTPIEKGGAKYDEDNLQWLCDHHHNIKRSTEDRK